MLTNFGRHTKGLSEKKGERGDAKMEDGKEQGGKVRWESDTGKLRWEKEMGRRWKKVMVKGDGKRRW
jgi:hypothetical protein